MKVRTSLLINSLLVWTIMGATVPWASAAGAPVSAPAPSAVTDIPGVIARVSASVVAIVGKPEVKGNNRDNRFNLAHGTGIVVKADGWILTNAHVVKEMDNLTVITVDGKQYAGTVTNMDEESDLALVKIAATGLSPAKFAANYSIKVGETDVAIGTPISVSLRNSASAGIISGVDRSVSSTYRLIQTDASINPGNSGGPLVNLKGEVVFTYGKVNRPYWGAELEESWAAVVGLPTKEPLRIIRVEPGSPAEKAGFQSGDVIYSVNQASFTTLVEFNELLKSYLPGQTVEIMVQSGGDLIKRKVTFGKQP
ncbi:S1C family serine protease [Brevibacillus centrosporus]|uniref:Serine protease Do n=1 Tax=Brevibacillus centrosporus TaxID=54910 RepID=A0A1I4A5I9_9BACL|nr:trypsin-like peptidase domain-containing protein [Brevibacillus centrosporus]MED4911700.1 trypsin-like peptidase domain-containing protein [Brevibacillus centrosporus]SFK51387.1 serine protease Do [Brevibacillus centrosporus]